MKQYRGCSKLFMATVTEGEGGALTFGTPENVAPVKTVSRDITSDSEKVYADNTVQEQNYGATTVVRTFSCTRIAAEKVAKMLGNSEVTFGTAPNTRKAYATPPSGATRPYLAFGYALHDGDPDMPCEIVWAYRGKVNSISQSANTIDDGTGSEGQDIEVEFSAPPKKWTATGKRDLDIALPIASSDTTIATSWFAQVVTPDNIGTVL